MFAAYLDEDFKRQIGFELASVIKEGGHHICHLFISLKSLKFMVFAE